VNSVVPGRRKFVLIKRRSTKNGRFLLFFDIKWRLYT